MGKTKGVILVELSTLLVEIVASCSSEELPRPPIYRLQQRLSQSKRKTIYLSN